MNLILFIKLLVTTIFLSAGLSKVKGFSSFIKSVREFSQFSNKGLINLIAFLIVIAEITFSILLLTPRYLIISSVAIILMLNLFSLGVIYKLNNKVKIKCNCGGFLGNHLISKEIPIRNSILSLGLLYIAFNSSANNEFDIQQFIVSEITVLLILFIYFFIKTANLATKA
ncbi:MAG TPA: MauE/DoxX family redox-associated membrane protein [Paenibacillus sp.]|jgi:uncharacterized membrane protein YphA (DoxX/SURF4 family)